MKKLLLMLILFHGCLFSITLEDVTELYKKGNYQKACVYAASIYDRMGHNEPYLSLYGYACLKSDNINSLTKPIKRLVKTKQGRQDARYFASILFQKKMLYNAVVDGEDISYINLPSTEYILSKIFTRYVKKDFKKIGNEWIFEEGNNIKHTMTQALEDGFPKIYIKSYEGEKLIKTRVFW